MPDPGVITSAEITPERIAATERLIRPHIRRTPVVEINSEDFGLPPFTLIFKLELLQHSGSFKARGAFANLLLRKVSSAGVVAASGGNHGAAVAYAAMKLGKPARIFVPKIASPEKIERIRSYGAELTITGEHYADALAASEIWAAESGALPIHAYNQIETILGQGTVGVEFEAQAPALDALLVAVGGGGLIGGIAASYANRTEVIGAEPEKAPTLTKALAAGKPTEVSVGGVAADSLGAKQAGELMFPLAQKYVHRTILVSDDEILQAQNALWKAMRVACEPGGAAAFAAALSRRFQPHPRARVGVLLCGGNTTAVSFSPTGKS